MSSQSHENKDVEYCNYSLQSNKTEDLDLEKNFSIVKFTCYACKRRDYNLKLCMKFGCGKFYHRICLNAFPNASCPLHHCASCKKEDINLHICKDCPSAFHVNDKCCVPGSVILADNMMVCPEHCTPQKYRKYAAVENLLFCVQCGDDTDLIFCESCPFSAHKTCTKDGKFLDGKYVCNRCETREKIYFNDIVWVKIPNFRWWPARVINPKAIPEEVKKTKHYKGEFPIQFFGTGNYYWTQMGRIYPFTYKSAEKDRIYENAMKLVQDAIKEEELVKEIARSKIPPHYEDITTNCPIGNVKCHTLTELTFKNICFCDYLYDEPCYYGIPCLNRTSKYECRADVCEAGRKCGNQKFQRKEYAWVKPFLTEKKGWGLKSSQLIFKDYFIIEYVGELIDKKECERRFTQKQKRGDKNFYFCELDSERIIDAGTKGNLSRFVNHSCEPNCKIEKWWVNNDWRIGIFAKSYIASGDELTIDYRMNFSHFEKFQCNCKSEKCCTYISARTCLMSPPWDLLDV